ncbi:MAG TPA: DOMON-like domain-containing protein [Steroidobacteraceae bacterium]|nr:DOMON-like domain-containing protein [Steroidobacteraceae bacterium]
MSGAITRIDLAAHPTTTSPAITSLEVQLAARAELLDLRYVLHADLARVRVPESVPAERADGLWRHTCFEAFLATAGTGYLEFNFSPGGPWAAYRFEGYRQGRVPLSLAVAPEIAVRRDARQLEVHATVQLPDGALADTARPKLALSAVVEEDSGRLCYWAARHAAGPPDFHHPDAFVIEL